MDDTAIPLPADQARAAEAEPAPDRGKDRKGSGRKGGGRKGRNGKGRSKSIREPRGQVITVLPTAGPARPRARHFLALLAFLVIVVAPTAAAWWYLETRAADQYASEVGFTVQRENPAPSATDLIGGLSRIVGGSQGSDADILYEFIQSSDLVRRIDARLDLRAIWSKPIDRDPVFALAPDAQLEDLVDYWNRMVRVYYDSATGLIQLRVLAFDPDDAFRIAQAIVEESTQMINRLNERSREDALRYARADLDAAAERLKKARQALTEFRAREQIVDPNADIQSQVGLLGSLQQQLANALIEYDLLRTNTREGDPRLRQLEQRIEVIRKRIEEERRKFGSGEEAAPAAPAGAGGRDYAKVVSEYEGLLVEREFAEKAYLSALSAYESARSAAQRQTRYLATFIGPTRPETAEYPQRWLITALIGGFAFLTWVIVVLVGYSIRDRR